MSKFAPGEAELLSQGKVAAAMKARLDAEGTAKPLTRIIAHVTAGDCIGPANTIPDHIEDVATGERIPLSLPPTCACCKQLVETVDSGGYCKNCRAPEWRFKDIPGYVIVSNLCFEPKEALAFAALVRKVIQCDVKMETTSSDTWRSVHVPERFGKRASELRVAFEAGKSFQYDVEGYR